MNTFIIIIIWREQTNKHLLAHHLGNSVDIEGFMALAKSGGLDIMVWDVLKCHFYDKEQVFVMCTSHH